MTPNAFKACFEILFKLYDNLKADYILMIGEKEKNLLFFNAFSADHQNVFVQQQKLNPSRSVIQPTSLFANNETRGCQKRDEKVGLELDKAFNTN